MIIRKSNIKTVEKWIRESDYLTFWLYDKTETHKFLIYKGDLLNGLKSYIGYLVLVGEK